MGTAREKQEDETDTRIMKESSKKSGRNERKGTKGKSPKQDITSAADLNNNKLLAIMINRTNCN